MLSNNYIKAEMRENEMQFSLICIYNNEEVLKKYLEKGLSKQKDVTYEKIFINNINGKYKNARDALIEGAKTAKGKYFVFCHQDILFEDEKTLKKIFDMLENYEDFGIAGVAGKKDKNVHSNILHGKLRENAGEVQIEQIEEVDTLDECLFIIKKDTYINCGFEKLICNTWHLYAVEYSLLMKQKNQKVIVLPIELYHQSSGASFDNTYYKQIKKLSNKYRKLIKIINTTIGNWYTNRILLNVQILKRKIRNILGHIKKYKNKSQQKNNHNPKIYIATHKVFNEPKQEGYVPIQVGAKINENLPYLKDDTGDNISGKNKNYCELTALYWIWKNTDDEIVGLSHYRRYFFKNRYSNDFQNILTSNEANKILKKYDIILPKQLKLGKSVEEQYQQFHNVKDLYKCKEIIEKKYSEYVNAFNKILKRNRLYAYNMFIMKREYFNSYMKWLFDILAELEEQIDITKYDSYNQRVYGFLSERLFNVWIEKNNLKIKKMTVYNTEIDIRKQ